MVSVTVASASKYAEHVAPQVMPEGELVTVPCCAPDLVTVNWGFTENVAVTVLVAS